MGFLAAQFDALMETCGAAVLVLDASGRVLRANAAAQSLLSVVPTPIAGRTLLEVTLSREMHRLLQSAVTSRSNQRAEMQAPGAAGGSLLVSVTPATGAGLLLGYVLVARNVTQLRRLETVRRDFVANVSHELRTPLASIRAMAETLADGALEDPTVAQPFLADIIAETGRLARIADDLLILADAEQRPAEDRVYDLSALVTDVVHRLQAQARGAGVSLTLAAPEGVALRGIADQMEQVVVNLVDNAIKYTPPGGDVRVEVESEPGTVTIRVSDTGIGMLSQDLPRVFERFYRVDKARSRQSGGTGLGLAIVKHIVESHGGTVTVESALNRGSTFTVSLPCPNNKNRLERNTPDVNDPHGV